MIQFENQLLLDLNALTQCLPSKRFQDILRDTIIKQFLVLGLDEDHRDRLVQRCVSSVMKVVDEDQWCRLHQRFDTGDYLLTLPVYRYVKATLLNEDQRLQSLHKRLSSIEKDHAQLLIQASQQDEPLRLWLTTKGIDAYLIRKQTCLNTITKAVITHCLPDQLVLE